MNRMTKWAKKNKWMVLLVECMILIISFLLLLQNRNHLNVFESGVGIEDWSSDYASYDGAWYIDSDMMQTTSAIDMLYGPYISAPRGYYTVNVWYECDVNQAFQPFANAGNDTYIESGTGILDKHLQYVSYRFRVTEDIDNLEIQIKYNGQGYLKVNNIAIESNLTGYKQGWFFLVLGFIIVDIILFWNSWLSKNKKTIWALAGILLMTSLPVLSYGINAGHDLSFHLMRIEGIAEALKAGQFPVRMSSIWMAGYGYPTSIYYGDILLYIPALLRILGFTVITSYKIYLVLVNALTVILSYICFKKIFKWQDLSLLVSLAYCTSSYRLMNIYVRAAVGEYSAMAFLSVIALAIYNIYTDDIDCRKNNVKNALILAFGMTGVIQTHILSAEMVVFFLAAICVWNWKKTFRLGTIFTYMQAVVAALMLNLWFIVPFLDYYRNVPVSINSTVTGGSIQKIQEKGAYLLQYFSFLQTPFGYDYVDVNERMALTPGVLLMAGLCVAIILWINKKANKTIYNLVMLSIVTLFIASNMFPWNYFAANCKIGNLLAQVQFPWRYIGISTIFLSLLLGFVLAVIMSGYEKCKSTIIYIFLAVVGVGSACEFASLYSNEATIINYYDSVELDQYDAIINGEYLRNGNTKASVLALNNEVSCENIGKISVLSRQGTDMEIYCETYEQDGTIILPIFNYKGYRVIAQSGEKVEIQDGPDAEIAFRIPALYKGIFSVKFVSPWYWRAAEMASLISFILIGVWMLKNYQKNTRDGLLDSCIG